MSSEDLGSLKDVFVTQENGKRAIAVTGGGQAVDVAVQDQTTRIVILPFNQVNNSTTLAAEALINQRDIVVASATGIVVGSLIILFSLVTGRFYFGKATVISGAPTIVLDTPLDSTFPLGTAVDIAVYDLSINGLTTPQIFGLRGLGIAPGVDLTIDITRIIVTCIADGPVSLSLFGDLTALLNGLVLRKRNGTNRNIFNIKTNRELAGIAFDYDVTQAINPAQGENGFKSRLTFGGQNKIGVVVRLPPGEDLEFIVQDNLAALLSLIVVAEGHVVEE